MAARLLKNTVIGGGPVGGEFNAPVGQTQSFDIPVGGAVATCWYVPTDDIPSLMGWDHIDVGPSGTPGNVTLTIKPNSNNLLRIFIYGE